MVHKRDATIDIAKGIGMIIVVLFHSEILSGIWTQFHMPLFAFLSGILYREKYNVSIKQVCVYTRKKIEGCYVPFVMYNLIFMVLHNFFYKIHIYGELSNGIYYRLEDYLRKTISILTMGGGESIPGPMWYLIAMLEFTVLYAVIRYGTQKYVRNNKICNVLITFICLIFMLVGFSKFDLPRMLNRALVLVFYYHLGYMAHTYWDFQTIGYEYRKKKYATALCSIGILIIGMCMGGGLAYIFMVYCSIWDCRNYLSVKYIMLG